MELKGGLIVNDDAVALALQLEADGHVLSVKDGKLIVSNGATLTDAQKAAIRQHRLQLLGIIGYEVPA